MNNMKLLLWISSLCLRFSLYAQDNASDHVIHWRNDLSWDEVKALAKQKGNNIFLDCYATWCGPCKMMDKQVYSNDSIASYLNENFVSIRLQMDSTSQDNEMVKKWFALAYQVKNKYGITELPTLLFLSPNDTLLDKRIGYQNINNFLATAHGIPLKIRLYNQITEYKKGIREYSVLPELADFAKRIIGDNELSNQIINVYKEGYLEQLSIDSLLTRKNLDFVFSNSTLIRSQDQLFNVLYKYPKKVDSVLGQPAAVKFVNWLVTKEELLNKLVKNNKPISKSDPDWQRLEKSIRVKYPKVDASALVKNFCISYYRYYNLNWSKWAYYKSSRIKNSLPDYKDQVAVSAELNDGGAWDAFVNCNEKTVLKIALNWINLAIKLGEMKQPGVSDPGYLDTKANVLYKLGDVNEAIKFEQKAIQASLKLRTEDGDIQAKSFELALEQMRAGEPTYVKDGAVWDERTLPAKTSNDGFSSK